VIRETSFQKNSNLNNKLQLITMALPKMPSLADLGLTVNQIRGNTRDISNQASDGKKKVAYKPNRPRNVRPYQNQNKTPLVESKSKTEKPYPTLTIAPHAEKIATYIQQYPVIAIDAPTGTGKTRYITYIMAKKGFKVRAAIPTTVAVRDAYQFQRKHTNLQVGYAAGREIKYSDDDQLVYGTTGHFTQRIIGLIKSNRRDHIPKVLGDIFFIDEVHAATSHITLLIGLIRYLFTNSEGEYVGPKIVFTTATFNHGDIIDHFDKFPVYKVEIPSQPIEDIFLTKPSNPLRDDPNEDIYQIVRQEMERWKNAPRKYHGIIFRPGLQEVEDTIEYLENKFSSEDPIEFYPAYSSLDPVELDEIFTPSNNMKIIVGTNIIESSITIEDVGFIVDDMLEKIAETSSTGGNKLSLVLESKAGSQQRRGRTGRTIEGRAYKLIDQHTFEKLPAFRMREIDRVPIFDIVLQLIDANLNPRDILKIGIARYDQARRLLIEFGMIENRGDRYFVTQTGQFVSSIPLSVHNAYMVYLGYQRFMELVRQNPESIDAERILLRSVLAVASMIEVYGPCYFYIPRKTRNETIMEYNARKDAHIEKYHEKFRGQTDIHTMVNIFWEMMTSIDVAKRYDRSTQHRFTDYVREWARDNSMNNKKIREYLQVMRDIESIVESKINNDDNRTILPRGLLGEYGFSLGRDLPTGGYVGLGNVIARLFARAYLVNHFIRDKDHRGNVVYVDPKTSIQYKINRNTSFNTMVINDSEGPTEIVVAQTIEVVGRGGGQVHLAGIFVGQEYIPEESRAIAAKSDVDDDDQTSI
jgi:HrpA-like RNA helicase